jgi:hypothetical protein
MRHYVLLVFSVQPQCLWISVFVHRREKVTTETRRYSWAIPYREADIKTRNPTSTKERDHFVYRRCNDKKHPMNQDAYGELCCYTLCSW